VSEEEEGTMQSTRMSAGAALMSKGGWSGAQPEATSRRRGAVASATQNAVARTLVLVEAESRESTDVRRTRLLLDSPPPAPAATRSRWALLGMVATVGAGIVLGFAAVLMIAG
jgi:hypothetical protein